MPRFRLFPAALLLVAALWSQGALARGAWQVESQYAFNNPEGVGIVGPFVDQDVQLWVLGNDTENGNCVLFGPFGESALHQTDWTLPDVDDVPTYTQCIAVASGPDAGFLIRGYILIQPVENGPQPITCGDDFCDAFEAPMQPNQCPADCGPLGFIAYVDSNFELVWGPTWDEDYIEVGDYDHPLPEIGWSESRDRVLVFFQTLVDIGPDSVPELHGVSIADGTGLVRRVITSWGNITDGELEGLLVTPEDGRFLVVGHSNGSQFLLYNGLESIESYPAGGIDWSTEKIAYVQFGSDESLYVQHYPRLDVTGAAGSLSRISTDGSTAFYTRSLERVAEVPVPDLPDPVEVTLRRPVLAYVTDSTFTFVRQLGSGEFALHTFDNFNGRELGVQPLSTIDENPPTHVADAGQPDRLILMTQLLNPDLTIRRFVDIIAFDLASETPGGIPDLEDTTGDTSFPDAPDAGGGDAGGDAGGGGGGGSGCCQTAVSQGSHDTWLTLAGLLSLGLIRRRRRPAAR